MNSGHIVEVVDISNKEKHPNADSLSVVKVDAYNLVINTAAWEGVNKAAYIKSDSLVDVTRPEFAWLADKAKEGWARIKVTKLRGLFSYGILCPIPDHFNVGDDVTEYLGVKHYVPDAERDDKVSNGETCKAPELVGLPSMPSLEHLKKYHKLIPVGTRVQISEKVDGSASCFVYVNGEFHVRSMNNWKREFPDTSHLNLEFFMAKGKTQEEAQLLVDNVNNKPKKQCKWWNSLKKSEPLTKFLVDNPETFVFAELFGNVNRIKYNLEGGDRVAVFDIWKKGELLAPNETLNLCRSNNIEHVPVLHEDYVFEDVDTVIDMAEGKSGVIGCRQGTIREGVVVKPLTHIFNYKIGTVRLKCHSPSFLLI